MMAKMFYTLDETKVALGRSEEEIKQLAREGRLREFRDGPRLMFKADQVEQLKGDIAAGGDHVDLGPSDSGSPIGLADSRSSSATGVTLSDTGQSGSSLGMQFKEDSGLAADLGLSGSMGGVPSPGHSPDMSRAGSAAGLNVFGVDEAERVDPSAQTAISSSIQDQVNLEGVGSGSGLLDLTRESDDTSLGAELLDEITPGGTVAAARRGTAEIGGSGTMSGLSPEPIRSNAGQPRIVTVAPQAIEEPDSMAPAFAGLAIGGLLCVFIGIYALAGAMMGYRPGLVESMATYTLPVLAGIMAGICVVFFILGMVLGKVAGR